MTSLKILDYPHRIVLELTPQCNLSCSMCPRNYVQTNDGYMNKDLWRRLINDIAKTEPDAVVLPFWRGESLLHPDFIELIQYALNKSLRIHISTNGNIVTGEYAEILARCEFVTFSIHTRLGYENAKDFLSIKKNDKPIVQVSFVKGEDSETILQEVINSSDLNGFDSVRLYEEHTKDGIFGKSGSPDKISRIFCPKLTDTLVIAYDGSVSRCNHVWETENGINFHDMSIKDIWNSDCLRAIRENYPDGNCGPCDQWTGHTCGESWYLVDGEIEHKRYGEMNDENKKFFSHETLKITRKNNSEV